LKKDKIKEYRDIFIKTDKDLKEKMKNKDFMYSAFIYELKNTEYCLTYDKDDVLSVF
jgi:hypothetical protein